VTLQVFLAKNRSGNTDCCVFYYLAFEVGDNPLNYCNCIIGKIKGKMLFEYIEFLHGS